MAKKGQCNNYTVFIASRWFNSLDDFINLEIGCPRFKGNMEKFHYNPISVDEKTINFFPNVETLHLYNGNDKLMKKERITMCSIDYTTPWDDYMNIQEECEKINIEMLKPKNIIFTRKDYLNKINGNGKIKLFKSYCDIPEGVSEIGEFCFEGIDFSTVHIPTTVTKIHPFGFSQSGFKAINIPSSVKYIGKGCFDDCISLTNITIPIHSSMILCGKQIFINKNSSLCSLQLPTKIKIINGKEIKNEEESLRIPEGITSISDRCLDQCQTRNIEIPTSIVSIGDFCFGESRNLTTITIPSTVTYFGKKCFGDLRNLYNINIPIKKNMIIIGNQIFVNENGQLYSLGISSNCNKINNEKVEKINSIEIPNGITSFYQINTLSSLRLKEITLPKTFTELNNEVITENRDLRTVNIPRSCDKILKEILGLKRYWFEIGLLNKKQFKKDYKGFYSRKITFNIIDV